MISKKDLNFLINLGKELKTQDNLGTRKPLIFKIMDKEIIECGEGNEDFEKLCLYTSGSRSEVAFEVDEINKAKEFLRENYCYLDEKGLVDCENFDELIDYFGCYGIEYKIRYFMKISKYTEEFLTRKAAKEHLKKYHYRYSSEAKIFCGCAVENEEITELTEIIERIYEENKEKINNFTKIKDLPVGTRFWVVNGCWTGKIIKTGGAKRLLVEETNKICNIDDDNELIIKILK